MAVPPILSQLSRCRRSPRRTWSDGLIRDNPATRTHDAKVQVSFAGTTISGGARDGAEFVPARATLTTSAELPFVSDEGVRSMAAGDVRLADGRGQFSLRKIRPQCFNVTIPSGPTTQTIV